MPSKLVISPGFDVVTFLGWVIEPTEAPPELWLRSAGSAPSPDGPEISGFWIPMAVPVPVPGTKEAVPDADISRVVPRIVEVLPPDEAAAWPPPPNSMIKVPIPRSASGRLQARPTRDI
jgi:hypothetical protein